MNETPWPWYNAEFTKPDKNEWVIAVTHDDEVWEAFYRKEWLGLNPQTYDTISIDVKFWTHKPRT